MADRIFKLTFLGDVSRALREMDKLGAGFQNMGSKTKVALGAAAVGGAAVGALAVKGFMGAISIAADYEKAIDAVAATAQSSASETKALWETGLRIGKETAFSATEAAAAMEVLAANGVATTDIINGAADAAVALAAAGGTDLVTAADLISTSMTVWGLKTKDLTDVTNRMAGAANVSRFGVEDMALAVAQGGGVAAAAGVEFGDFTTTVAAIASSFTSGSDAGTSLKTMFMRLNPQTKAARKEMEQLGLWSAKTGSVFYDAKGNLKSMADVTDLLHNATKGLTEEQRTQAFTTIFGTDAFRAAAALAQHTGEEFRAMDAKMAGANAADIAKARMGNLKGSLEQLNGALETIAIELGAKFLPVLTQIANGLAEWLPKIPTWALLAVGGFMLLIGAVSALGLALIPILTMMSLLGIEIGAVSLAFLGIPLAIAAVIGIGYMLWTHWDSLSAKALELRDRILDLIHVKDTFLEKPVGGLLEDIGFGITRAINPLVGVVGAGKAIQSLFSGGAPAPGVRGGEGDVPLFASGGIVGGPRGSAQLAIVHGGETVLPTHKGGGFMGNVTVNVMGNTMQSDSVLQRLILDALTTAQQRGSLGIA